jgi:hypothetical protein
MNVAASVPSAKRERGVRAFAGNGEDIERGSARA